MKNLNKMVTPEDRFNQIIDNIENRAMAADGPVTPTLQEATEDELSELWELVNEISPKRKALARKVLKNTVTDEGVIEYLRQAGLDPEQVAREGSTFVKAITENIKLKEALRNVLKYIDDGSLVRDISKDHEPEWSMRMLRFVLDLKAAQNLLNPK